MLQGEVDEAIDAMHPLYGHWQFLRSKVYDRSESVCEQLASAIGPLTYGEPGNLPCADAAAAQSIFMGREVRIAKSYCEGGGSTFTTASPGTGTGGDDEGTDDTGESSGPEIYGLTSYSEVLDCVPGTHRECDVDERFVEYLADNLELLWEDDIMVDALSFAPGMTFTTCGADSLPYALGFREGDVVMAVEVFGLAGYQSTWDLWGHFIETGYETVTVHFVRDARELTLTVNQVEF